MRKGVWSSYFSGHLSFCYFGFGVPTGCVPVSYCPPLGNCILQAHGCFPPGGGSLQLLNPHYSYYCKEQINTSPTLVMIR